MQFKRSAGVFVAGISMFIGGPLLSWVAAMFLAWSATRGDGSLAAVFMGLAFVGGVLSLIGFVLLIVATHRALVKIDALPVGVQPASRQDWFAPTR